LNTVLYVCEVQGNGSAMTAGVRYIVTLAAYIAMMKVPVAPAVHMMCVDELMS